MTIRIVESKVEAAKAAVREFISHFKLGKEESVIQKGYRLFKDKKVTVAQNTPTFVSGTVQGDHGTYEVKIYRNDPKSFKTTYDTCECDWETYRWDRSRNFKHLEGRICSHIRALQLASQSTPLDMEGAEEGYKPAPGQRTKPFTEEEKAERDFDKNDGAIPGLAEQGEAEQAKSLPRSFGPDGEILDEGWQEKPKLDPSLMDNKNLLRQPMENPFLAPKPKVPKGDNPLVSPQQRKPMTLHDFIDEPGAPQPGPGQMSMPNMNPPGADPENPNSIPGSYSSVRLAMGMNGDLPEGLTFRMEDRRGFVQGDPGPYETVVAEVDGRAVGHLMLYKIADEYVYPDGESTDPPHYEVYHVSVDDDLRRRGVADAMMEYAHEEQGYYVEHSHNFISDEGRAWGGGGGWHDRTAALDDRIFEPMEDVLIDVQLESPDDPGPWVAARIVEHRPDTEGEAWDEDDYVIEWSGQVPDDDWCTTQTEGGRCEVPASWVHGIAEDWSDQEPVWSEEKVFHRASVRTAMAERTGVPKLDALLDEFITANPAVVGDAAVGYRTGDPDSTLDQMRSPEYAQGRCGLIAHQFTGWLLEQGVTAWTTDDMSEGHQADWHGYEDRPGEGSRIDTSHCATAIEWDGRTYLVDWSASQYGYTEWPMVQLADGAIDQLGDASPQWQRNFTASIEDIPVFIVHASEFHYGEADDVTRQIEEALRYGRRIVFALRNPVALEASGGKIPMPGAQPIGENEDGLPIYRWQELGWDPVRQRRVNQNELFDDQVGSPQLKGQYGLVQPGRSGEILDYEPMLKSVFVHIPINDMGKLAPHVLTGWIDLQDVILLDTEGALRSPFRAAPR